MRIILQKCFLVLGTTRVLVGNPPRGSVWVECAHARCGRMYLEPLGVPKGGQRVQTLLPREHILVVSLYVASL